jgi:hypothetical protein
MTGEQYGCPRPDEQARDAAGLGLSPARPPRPVMVIPTYRVAVALVTVLVLCLASFFGSIAIAQNNSRDLIGRYRADQAAAANANRAFYCSVFARQANVFADAESEVGRAAYEAWLDLYRFAHCVPAR